MSDGTPEPPLYQRRAIATRSQNFGDRIAVQIFDRLAETPNGVAVAGEQSGIHFGEQASQSRLARDFEPPGPGDADAPAHIGHCSIADRLEGRESN